MNASDGNNTDLEFNLYDETPGGWQNSSPNSSFERQWHTQNVSENSYSNEASNLYSKQSSSGQRVYKKAFTLQEGASEYFYYLIFSSFPKYLKFQNSLTSSNARINIYSI